MGRSNRNSAGRRHRSRENREVVDAVRGTLLTLRSLCDSYDSGNFSAARTIAVEIHRLVVGELAKLPFLRKLQFLSSSLEDSPHNLAKQCLMSFIRVGNCREGEAVGEISFIPFCSDTSHPALHSAYFRSFPKWWNAVVIRDGAGPNGLIPLNVADQTPFNERAHATRREVIEVVRNKLGAHFDGTVSEYLHFIEENPIMFVELGLEIEGQEFTTGQHPEKFRYSNTLAHATCRQIAWEILASESELMRYLEGRTCPV